MKRLTLFFLQLTIIFSLSAQSTIEVAVMSLNDFHGCFVRDDFKEIPGAPSIVETLDSLKRVYPAHIVVSAGDNFGGSYYYQATRTQTLLPQFFKDCDITLSAVGNHEFDEGQEQFCNRWHTGVEYRPQSWDIEYISANIRPRICAPFSIRPIILPDGREFKMAFVGLTTSSTPRQASSSKVKGLSFDGNIQSILDSISRLPEFCEVKQANGCILLTHQGTAMQSVRRGCIIYNDPVWDDADSLALSQISDELYHGILSSHSHRPVCGRINDHKYPIVQGGSYGKFVSILKFKVDSTSLEVLEVEPQLIRVTPKSHFTPKAARLQAQIDEQLATTRTKGGAALGEVLTMATEDIPFDRTINRYDHTRIGQLVSHAYSHALRQQDGFLDESLIVGVTHVGGIRNGIQAGQVRVMDVGEVLPFDNALRAFKVNGKQLRQLIDFGLHNKRYGYLQYANLTTEMDKKGHVKALSYTTPSGRMIKIKDSSTCYIVADEFVSNGGDGYDVSLFPSSQELRNVKLPRITDALINYLRTLKNI